MKRFVLNGTDEGRADWEAWLRYLNGPPSVRKVAPMTTREAAIEAAAAAFGDEGAAFDAFASGGGVR